VATGFLGVAAVASANPVFSPDGSRTANVENGQLYVGGVQRLSSDAQKLDRSPAWSPDGTKIAVSGRENGREALFLFDAAGKETPVTLAETLGLHITMPVWSSDGSKLAFIGLKNRLAEDSNSSQSGAAFIADVREKGWVNQMEGKYYGAPAWDPLRQRVGFIKEDGQHMLLHDCESGSSREFFLPIHMNWPLMKAQTGTEAKASGLKWSPNGQHVAYVVRVTSGRDYGSKSFDQITMVSPDQKGDGFGQGLTTGEWNKRVHDHTWSPDSSRIAYAEEDLGNNRMDVLALDIKHQGFNDGTVNLSQGANGTYSERPEWSPTGEKVAFTTRNRDLRGEAAIDIEVAVSAGTGRRPERLTFNRGESVSTDPLWIAPDRLIYHTRLEDRRWAKGEAKDL
jgi:Tol biopolymer transport system component